MEELSRCFKIVIEAKERRRRDLAKLSYPEKVRAVVQMQKMAYPLARKRTSRACVWEI